MAAAHPGEISPPAGLCTLPHHKKLLPNCMRDVAELTVSTCSENSKGPNNGGVAGPQEPLGAVAVMSCLFDLVDIMR